MNVTLKEFPNDLHSRLKSLAEANGRGLNRQIIHTPSYFDAHGTWHALEAVTSPRKTDDSELLSRIKINRESIVGRIDQKFLDEAIDDSRP